MNLRKLNALISLITTILLFEHMFFYSVWMLLRGSLAEPPGATPRAMVAMVLVVLHAVLSILMAVLAHKGEEKQKQAHKTYTKLNIRTMLQRMSGLAMLVLLALHVAGANTYFRPKLLHGVFHPLFFAVVLAHVAVSGSKALITLGVGNAKLIKALDVWMPVLCGVIFVAAVAGFHLCLFMGVVK